MSALDLKLSRISKLFLDRDQMTFTDVLARRQQHTVTLILGDDVANSYTLQLAVLTAANIATRCFPGAVRVTFPTSLKSARLLVWPALNLTFCDALAEIAGPSALADSNLKMVPGRAVIFGNAPDTVGALRATFDGWMAKVGLAAETPRLPEREYCSLTGILAASLAISELFLSFARVSVEAGRRTVGISLWRPDLHIGDPDALGIPVQFLPREFWMLGLGHLGNAYLWSIGTLPYADPTLVNFFLNDFDVIEPENIETGMIFRPSDCTDLKTRACKRWLERPGFQTRLVERPFDDSFRRRDDEPGLALCGFDSNSARRDLATARFPRVIESGLGGTANNFDTISVHTLPNPRAPAELWPDPTKEDEYKRVAHQERVARDNAAYLDLGRDECGRFALAGKSVAVPFVGAVAATLVVAEAIRLLHDGPAYTDIKLRLASGNRPTAQSTGNYRINDCAGIHYCDAISDL
jgi:hypothetical protein